MKLVCTDLKKVNPDQFKTSIVLDRVGINLKKIRTGLDEVSIDQNEVCIDSEIFCTDQYKVSVNQIFLPRGSLNCD